MARPVIWANVLREQLGAPPLAVRGLDLSSEFGGQAPHLRVGDGRQMAAASPSAVSAGRGPGPAPSGWMIRAELGWLAASGAMTAGIPLLSPVPVVPAPPSGTAAAMRGNSHAWGMLPAANT